MNSQNVYSDVNEKVIVFRVRVRRVLSSMSGMYMLIFIPEEEDSLPCLNTIEGEVVKYD